MEQPASQEGKAKEWLQYGWKKGAELVSSGEILYDAWWKEMQKSAAEFWGCKPDSDLATDMVRPIYWEQGGKVWKYDGKVCQWTPKDETPSRLVAINGGSPPCYKDDYTVYILANLEWASSGIKCHAIVDDELRKHLPGYRKSVLDAQEKAKKP